MLRGMRNLLLARRACAASLGLLIGASVAACSGNGPWLSDSRVLVPGVGVTNTDCRNGFCQHDENTDMISWKGAIWLVHRTARSQILGPNSSLHIYRSSDNGATFAETAKILAPTMPDGRDIRDPSFFVVGDRLFLKALTRLPVTSERDTDVDTDSVAATSADGVTWTDLQDIGPHGWSFWRVREHEGVYWTAAYADGDKSVALFSSTDGLTWTRGADVYTTAVDTPLETELTFMTSGLMLALVRMDGTDDELFGDKGRLRTAVCWASPPYTTVTCPQVLYGVRLDGPLTFMWRERLFVVARKHLQPSMRKRTALFEIVGNLPIDDQAPLSIDEVGELPSAGDTAYAGAAFLDDHRVIVSWYSGDLVLDESWILGMLDATDIRVATIDLSQIPVDQLATAGVDN
jgi:hypothetical protein